MMTVIVNGVLREMEFREFAQRVRDGLVPHDAIVRGDVLTAGQAVPASELRTYAILRGHPLPPPREFPCRPEDGLADVALSHIRWYPSIRLGPKPPPSGEVSPSAPPHGRSTDPAPARGGTDG
jgi:hypothetical protein